MPPLTDIAQYLAFYYASVPPHCDLSLAEREIIDTLLQGDKYNNTDTAVVRLEQ